MNTNLFDSQATTYDDDFTNTVLGEWLRARINHRLLRRFEAGMYILEMGCGTGEDALFLAEHGIRVLATDISDKMLAIAKEKTHQNTLIELMKLDIQVLENAPRAVQNTQFDGAFSNFGPLNCLSDWKMLSDWLARQVKRGGYVGLGIMGPYCIWEMLWHSVHLNFKTAFRRLSSSARYKPDVESPSFQIHYPTVHRITQDFAPHFRRVYLQPLGLFLPPSDVYGFVEKHPTLMKHLIKFEERFGRVAQLANFADHYWIEFEKI